MRRTKMSIGKYLLLNLAQPFHRKDAIQAPKACARNFKEGGNDESCCTLPACVMYACSSQQTLCPSPFAWLGSPCFLDR